MSSTLASPSIGRGRPTTMNTTGTGVSVSGLEVKEYGDTGPLRMTEFTFTDLALTTTDAGASGAYGSQKIYDAPQGNVVIHNSYATFTPTATSTNVTTAVKFSLGSAAEAANDTLDGTSANILPSTAGTLDTANKGVLAATGFINGSATASDWYLNVGIVDANSAGNGSLTVDGRAVVIWSVVY